MTQDNGECNDMNSAFEKLRIVSDESDKNMSHELDTLKPKIYKQLTKFIKKGPDSDSLYDFIVHTCGTIISQELIELVIKELISLNVIFNKKTLRDPDSFYKLNEKNVPKAPANSLKQISET